MISRGRGITLHMFFLNLFLHDPELCLDKIKCLDLAGRA